MADKKKTSEKKPLLEESLNFDSGYSKEGFDIVGSKFQARMATGIAFSDNPAKKIWAAIQRNIKSYVKSGHESGRSVILFPFRDGWESVLSDDGEILLESARQIYFTCFAKTWEQSVGYLYAVDQSMDLFVEAASNAVNPTNFSFSLVGNHPFIGMNGRIDNPGIWMFLAYCNFPVPAGVWEKFLDLFDDAAKEMLRQFRRDGGYPLVKTQNLYARIGAELQGRKGGGDESKK